MNPPKNRNSEARNAHMPSLALSSPVVVCGCAAGAAGALASVPAGRAAVTAPPPRRSVRAGRAGWWRGRPSFAVRLHGPAEDPEQGQQAARDEEPPVLDEAVADEREAQRHEERVVR